MDGRAAALVAAQGGVVASSQLARLGVAPRQVTGWVRQGLLVRLRRGAFAASGVWEEATPDQRYRLTVAAVLLSRDDAAASHHSALALHGLPLWHVDRRVVVLAADVSESRTSAGVRVTPLRALASRTEVDGLPTLAVADAVVTTASHCVEAGVVAGDGALHAGQCSLEELDDAVARLAGGLRGTAMLRRAIDLLDPAAESPGESRTRIALTALGLPVESQVEIRDGRGWLVGRVDLLVAGRVVVEFDGAVKYGGHDGADALVAEKRREDRLRELGYGVVRVTWSDLADPAQLRARIRRALARAAA